MSISSISSTTSLLKQLETNGLSADKAKLVQRELAASQGATSGGTTTAAITPSTRAAFEAKISADVLSGKLSASDAAAVRKTMDNLDGGATTTAAATDTAPAAAAAGSAGAAKSGGGGGGGGGSSKTEASEVVSISGSTMTTVITYTDGTTTTTTTTATDADKARYEKAGADTAHDASAAYTPPVDKGSLIDQVA